MVALHFATPLDVNLGIARFRLERGGRGTELHFFKSNSTSVAYRILTTVT